MVRIGIWGMSVGGCRLMVGGSRGVVRSGWGVVRSRGGRSGVERMGRYGMRVSNGMGMGHHSMGMDDTMIGNGGRRDSNQKGGGGDNKTLLKHIRREV